VPNMFERKERKMVEFVPEFYCKSLKNFKMKLSLIALYTGHLNKKQIIPYS
jgi:hypothetical protein